MIDQVILPNWWVFLTVASILIAFKWWMGFVTANRKIAIKQVKEQSKFQSSIKGDIDAYLIEPELTIEALQKQRQIMEKSGRTKEIEAIDQQIKFLQYATKIPRPLRGLTASAGNTLMTKVESYVKGL